MSGLESQQVILRNQAFCNQCHTFLSSDNSNSRIKIKCVCNNYNSGGLEYIDRSNNGSLTNQDIILYLRNPNDKFTQKIIQCFN